MKFTIVNQRPRAVLIEGRSKGMGFAFCQRAEETKLITVMPISPCKDYLNDVVFSENTGKPWSAYGLKTERQGIFGEGGCWLAIAICGQGAIAAAKYEGFDEETKQLLGNFPKMELGMRAIDAMASIPEDKRTRLYEANDSMVACMVPMFWCRYTYLISAYTLLMRNIMWWKGKGNPLKWLEENPRGEDSGYMAIAMPKLKTIFSGKVPEQKLDNLNPHNEGIVAFKMT